MRSGGGDSQKDNKYLREVTRDQINKLIAAKPNELRFATLGPGDMICLPPASVICESVTNGKDTKGIRIGVLPSDPICAAYARDALRPDRCRAQRHQDSDHHVALPLRVSREDCGPASCTGASGCSRSAGGGRCSCGGTSDSRGSGARCSGSGGTIAKV